MDWWNSRFRSPDVWNAECGRDGPRESGWDVLVGQAHAHFGLLVVPVVMVAVVCVCPPVAVARSFFYYSKYCNGAVPCPLLLRKVSTLDSDWGNVQNRVSKC